MNKIIGLAVVLLCAGCSGEGMHEKRSVEAIYWHEGDRYSAAIVNGDSVVMHRIPIYNKYRLTVAIDVKRGEKPWYECSWNFSQMWGATNSTCSIHIKSIDSLKTADWNHGKFGSGTTTRID